MGLRPPLNFALRPHAKRIRRRSIPPVADTGAWVLSYDTLNFVATVSPRHRDSIRTIRLRGRKEA